jgi:hypothetical protein
MLVLNLCLICKLDKDVSRLSSVAGYEEREWSGGKGKGRVEKVEGKIKVEGENKVEGANKLERTTTHITSHQQEQKHE